MSAASAASAAPFPISARSATSATVSLIAASLAAERRFARDGLAIWLDEQGVDYEPFDDLHDVARALRPFTSGPRSSMTDRRPTVYPAPSTERRGRREQDRYGRSDEGLPGEVRAVDDVSLEIESGEFMVLVGPSGCGKSTLLRMIAGLEEVTDGAIFIGDRDVTDLAPRQRDIAMVFQNYALYPHMTVRRTSDTG